jgi:hypothetical protein
MKIGHFFDRIAGAKVPKPIERKHANNDTASIRVPETPKHLSLTNAVIAIAVVAASFFLGVVYQKSQTVAQTLSTSGSSTNQSQNGSYGPSGDYGRFGRASMSTSTVTDVSGTSITVQDSSGNSATYVITAGTIITDSGQQVSANDIQTGDTVIVIPNRTNTSDARRIIVSPDFDNSQPESIDPSETQLN